MEFILENYMIIIFVGLFFVFALIGYLIDMLRKTTSDAKQESNVDIKPVNISKINVGETSSEPLVQNNIKQSEEKKDNADDLLANYDEEINK